jgi:hypothetical protein
MRKLKQIRIRFTIRQLLVITAALAISLYFLYVRPTLIANRFVVAVMRHDYNAAKSLLIGGELSSLDDETGSVDQVYAEVLPREWEDICKCQHKVIYRLVQHEEEGGRRVDWTADTDLVARWNGIKILAPVSMTSLTVELPARNETFRIPDYTLVP